MSVERKYSSLRNITLASLLVLTGCRFVDDSPPKPQQNDAQFNNLTLLVSRNTTLNSRPRIMELSEEMFNDTDQELVLEKPIVIVNRAKHEYSVTVCTRVPSTVHLYIRPFYSDQQLYVGTYDSNCSDSSQLPAVYADKLPSGEYTFVLAITPQDNLPIHLHIPVEIDSGVLNKR